MLGRVPKSFMNLIGIIMLLGFCLIIASNLAFASNLKLNQYDFSIIENKVVVKNTLIFAEPQTSIFEIVLPPDAELVSVTVDGTAHNITLINSENSKHASIDIFASKEISISYTTRKFLDGQTFLASLNNTFDAEMFQVQVTLPENVALKMPLNNEYAEGSIYPKPTRVESDGQLISFIWENPQYTAGEEFSAVIMYKEKGIVADILSSPVFIAVMVFFGVMLGIIIYAVYLNRKHRMETSAKARRIALKVSKTLGTKKKKKIQRKNKERAERAVEGSKLAAKEKIQVEEVQNELVAAETPDDALDAKSTVSARKQEDIDSASIEAKLKHLKEDEAQIVRVIMRREDHQIEQGTLRVITGMPKATLSRILKELEERNIIFKEKRGKRNMVFLR